MGNPNLSVRDRILLTPRFARLRLDAARFRITSRPSRWQPTWEVHDPNTIFSAERCEQLFGHGQRMAHNDPHLLKRVADTRLKGMRVWEYGTLLGALAGVPARDSLRGLDVGSGNSTFPLYMVETGNVGSMVCLDLPEAHEHQSAEHERRERAGGVERVEGSMLDLPFEDWSFDLVTCISAIEHLDADRHVDSKPPYDEYLARTRQGLAEMMRVLAPGGYIYLTTDAYIPELQKTDAWSSPRGKGPIWSAYRYEDIEATFVAAIEEGGGELVGPADYRRELLEESEDRASYRGRYFTTFALFARKPAPLDPA
jgi:SAM-dependent methyltransferase